MTLPAELFTLVVAVNTPLTPLPQESFAEFEPRAYALPDPDDPPWGVAEAFALWFSSFLLLAFVPALALAAYAGYKGLAFTPDTLRDVLTSDPNAILVSIVAVIPTHLLTVLLAWAVVTRFGKRPFWQTLGWTFGPHFDFWMSASLAVVLLVVGWLLLRAVGGGETELDQIITSSTAARFTTAFLATASAPFVEELIYRGVLYSALQRAAGVLWAVVGVSTLFALVHAWQYRNNLGVITTITILSFTLTAVRAATRRLLPCFVIHLVFNGIQSAVLVLQHFRPDLFDGGEARPGGLLLVPAARALSGALGLQL